MIVITGAAGFIGSGLLSKLNSLGYTELILVDDFSNVTKNRNLDNKIFESKIDREDFFEWMKSNKKLVTSVFHIGARTDTTEASNVIFKELNLDYSKRLWDICVDSKIPFIYASSAATYGDGKLGYNDDHEIVDKLNPLNPYGVLKNEFDKSPFLLLHL